MCGKKEIFVALVDLYLMDFISKIQKNENRPITEESSINYAVFDNRKQILLF